MMEIKFRAWDFQNDEMIYGVGITPDSDLRIPYKINSTRESPEHIDYYPASALMQFTGLHDKNGVEIYEKDITECFAFGLTTVEFRNGSFGLYSKYQGFFPFSDIHGRVVVVGNVYEHTHLLERSGEHEDD